MTLQKFRETVNLLLFKSKDRNLAYLQLISLGFSIFAIGSLVYFYGFPKTPESEERHLSIIRWSFGFYIFNYFIRFLYTFEPRQFLKQTRVELVMLSLVIFDTLLLRLTNTPFIHNLFEIYDQLRFKDYSIVFIQFYLLAIVLMDIGKASAGISNLRISPATLFIFSFFALIGAGSLLLWMPEMTQSGISLPYLDSVFLSTSACCVTGLSPIDISQILSYKGKTVLMLLIQLGGLNMITFASFFASFTQKGIGLKHHAIIMDFLSTEDLSNTKTLLKQVLFWSFLIEFLGAVLMFSLWNPKMIFQSWGEKVFYSIFHSVSAFNNAGFSLFTNGLMDAQVITSYGLHFVFIFLIFFGSLGFPAIQDLFGIRQIRFRQRLKWKTISISTRIAVYSSFVLIGLGTLFFYFLEKDNSLRGLDIYGTITTSIFAAVTPRTAGFHTVDYSQITLPAIIITIILMFIGASSGGTGGGIKTSTFVLLMTSAFATIRGKKNLELFKQSISFDLLNKAFSIVLFSTFILFLGVFCLAITEKGVAFERLFFETVSAFGTVGLSMNLTQTLSENGKIVIIVVMFIGRIGTLTLANSLSRKIETNKYRYPTAHFMVG
jgi:Trk-type K+ transport system membrane component